MKVFLFALVIFVSAALTAVTIEAKSVPRQKDTLHLKAGAKIIEAESKHLSPQVSPAVSISTFAGHSSWIRSIPPECLLESSVVLVAERPTRAPPIASA